MGSEVLCKVSFQGQTSEGKAYLESEKVTFRGTFRFDIPVTAVSGVAVSRGVLKVSTAEGLASFSLGPELAEKWANKLKNPRSLLDKLGVKAGQKLCVLGVKDEDFLAQLERKVGEVHTGRAPRECDLLIVAVDGPEDLERLGTWQRSIKRDGGIWIVRPKGKASKLADGEVIAAAKAQGLSVVKVAKFSETHTAEKLVIPLSQR